MARDVLIRNVTAVVVLACGIYCAFGMAAAVAADQHGTAIHHYEPISFSMLCRGGVCRFSSSWLLPRSPWRSTGILYLAVFLLLGPSLSFVRSHHVFE